MRTAPVRTLIVDDSALSRKLIADSLAGEPDIEVIGTAMDPFVARDKILRLKPDVLTLDLEMPRMDGLTFLKLLMKHHPLPVIILSALTNEGSVRALEALQAGAIDVHAKPSGPYSLPEEGAKLADKIRAAAQAKLENHSAASTGPPKTPQPDSSEASPSGLVAARSGSKQGQRRYSHHHVILLGASTGGTEAIKSVLVPLSGDLPSLCIVQHIPPRFSQAFARRLNGLCRFEVREAQAGDMLRPGLALIAPGGYHMLLKSRGTNYVVELNDGPRVHHQRPAVDVLFDSAAKAGLGPHALAILLTGMGTDGAAGLLKLHKAGATTLAQDQATCVVFGMPREAIRLGAAQHVLPLQQIAGAIERFADRVTLTGE
jgi:two-component system chemotaxis response regulator CheB